MMRTTVLSLIITTYTIQCKIKSIRILTPEAVLTGLAFNFGSKT